jgi:hypothetical protein
VSRLGSRLGSVSVSRLGLGLDSFVASIINARYVDL